MISKLKFKNFKCFEELDMDLKKVNIFTGINGMGKSTVIQSLLLLKQSESRFVSQNGLSLNGEYIELGNSQDVVYDKAEEGEVGIYFVTTDGRLVGNTFLFEQDSDFLPCASKEKCDMKLTDKGFVYISAYRIKPQERYGVINEQDLKECKFGNNGEFALQYLSVYGDCDITNPCAIEKSEKGNSLMNQTRIWMDRVSPGVAPQVKVMMDTRSSELKFDFIEGKERTNSYTSINVGFGITYVLPVVVALLSAKTGDIVIIENPEAHIHPAGQRMLGELIARVGAGGVQVFVETHSEHVVNGVRIAVKNEQIKKEDVEVAFFYKDDTDGYKHVYKSLQINDNGKMSSWPKGFFDEWEKAMIELL